MLCGFGSSPATRWVPTTLGASRQAQMYEKDATVSVPVATNIKKNKIWDSFSLLSEGDLQSVKFLFKLSTASNNTHTFSSSWLQLHQGPSACHHLMLTGSPPQRVTLLQFPSHPNSLSVHKASQLSIPISAGRGLIPNARVVPVLAPGAPYAELWPNPQLSAGSGQSLTRVATGAECSHLPGQGKLCEITAGRNLRCPGEAQMEW